ncbi:MAG: replication initiator protein A, partial [Bdellovibrionales bacterium]|nr:replication initiator protein A [Bdellovibrionales bacterium]
PLAVLSTRVNPKVKTLEFKDQQRLKTGETVEREWVITGADKFGLPTSTDDDVVLGLMRLTMDQGFRQQKVFFTRYELLKILRWTTEGRSYSRLTRSLDRLSGVRIRATNAFYDNRSKAFQTCNFGIIDAYEINDERGGRSFGDGDTPKSFFIWSEMLFESFKAGYIKKLDLDLYFSLRSAVSRRLYRYLDKHFYYRSSIELPLITFAFEKLGLSRSYKYVSSIRQQIEPAIDELTRSGFLAGCQISGRGSAATIRFQAGSSVQVGPSGDRAQSATAPSAYVQPSDSGSSASTSIQAQSPHYQTLFEKLLLRGINRRQVEKLLAAKRDHELERVFQIVAYYDSLIATHDRRVSRNPIGFLYRAVEEPFRFKLPKAFLASGAGSTTPEVTSIKRADRVTADERRRNDRLATERRASYDQFVDQQLAGYRQGIAEAELSEIVAAVQQRLEPLRTVLSSERFTEAVRGRVRDELISRAGLPSFEEWSRGSTRRSQPTHGPR